MVAGVGFVDRGGVDGREVRPRPRVGQTAPTRSMEVGCEGLDERVWGSGGDVGVGRVGGIAT